MYVPSKLPFISYCYIYNLYIFLVPESYYFYHTYYPNTLSKHLLTILAPHAQLFNFAY